VKIKRSLSIFALNLLLLSLAVCLYAADTVTSKELIKESKRFDGKFIIYQGEAVTAVMNRGGYSWVNINDGDNAIGVWGKRQLFSGIKFLGDYKHKGDIVRITGKFNRACAMHGGELDIHAQGIEIASRGEKVHENIDKNKIGPIIAIFILLLLSAVIFRKRI
jgi:hypothetical protein